MNRFTLIHDGSDQGWRTAYLAFHVAARLGAPLQILVADSDSDEETLAQIATQVVIGGRAAGVVIETRIVPDFSPDTIIRNTTILNGLFTPKHLVQDGETAAGLLEALSCPLWIVSEESVNRKMAVIVENPSQDEDLINYAATLSQRMNETLTGLIIGEGPPPTIKNSLSLVWIPLQDFSLPSIVPALDRLRVDLLFMRLSNIGLVSELDCSCVVYPGS